MLWKNSTLCVGVMLAAALTTSAHADDPKEKSLDAATQQRAHVNQSVSLAPEVEIAQQAVAPIEAAGTQPAAPIAGEENRKPTIFKRKSSELNPQTGPRTPGALTVRPDRAAAWYQSGLGALSIVLALVGVATWAARRWLPSAKIRDNALLRVVSRTTLSPKQSLALVHLGRRFLVLGISSERVSLLCEMTDPDEVADLVQRTEKAGNDRLQRFDSALLDEAARFDEPIESVSKGQPPQAFEKRARRDSLTALLQRLKTLKTH
jgi:flagellar biosynthetic protein FliO